MPTFSVAVLEGRVALTKRFTRTEKFPYPLVKNVKSTTKTISTIEQLADLIKHAAAQGACLLKGELDQELNWESRSGHHQPDKPTFWACFDIDHLPSIATIDDFLQRINATDVSYVLQWSCSYGVYGNMSIRAHLFLLLDKAYSPSDLKLWLKQINFQSFPNDFQLSEGDNTLKWGLDVSVCQNDKLIFVAPPICTPTSLNTHLGDRIILVKKGIDYFTLPPDRLSVAQIKALEKTKVDELRKAKGLSASKAVYKDLGGIEYLAKPDQATIQVMGVDNGFVRINLNGGDSAAYYHPIGNPTILYNFKGEPNYKIQELDPDYYYRTINAERQVIAQKHKGKLFLGFRDFRTSLYYNGTYDESTEELVLARAGSITDVKDFLVSHGQPELETMPTWDAVYDPHAPPLDLDKKQVNFFVKSKYMREAETRQSHQPFPRIDALMRHVVGPSCINHWYNWLAFVYQRRIAPGTAWVWHGTQGTGKGLVFNTVLKLLLGSTNVTEKRMEQLEKEYTDHLDNCLLCFVDEAEVSESPRNKTIMANLKNQITEPMVDIRRMYVPTYSIINRVGWIFASNMPTPVTLTDNDRRFNIAEFQGTPLPQPTPADIEAIEAEITDFAVFLRLYQVDEMQARQVLKNKEREDMIDLSQQAGDRTAGFIKNGSLSDLWNELELECKSLEPRIIETHYQFRTLMFDLVKTKRNKLTRSELYAIFDYCVGNVQSQPSKFTSYLRHRSIAIGNLRVGNVVTKGITVDWKDPQQWFDDRRAEILQIDQPKPLKVVK